MSSFDHVQMQSDAQVQRDRQFFYGQANELRANSGQVMLQAANQINGTLLNQREMAMKEAQAQASLQMAQQEQQLNQMKLQAMAQIDEADIRREQLNAARQQNRLMGAQADQAEAQAKRYASMAEPPDRMVDLLDKLDAENVAKHGYKITAEGPVPFANEAEQAAALKRMRRESTSQVDSDLDYVNALIKAQDLGLTDAEQAVRDAYRRNTGRELNAGSVQQQRQVDTRAKVALEQFNAAYQKVPAKVKNAMGGETGWSDQGKSLFYDSFSREYDQRAHTFNTPKSKDQVFADWMRDFSGWPVETRRIALRMMGLPPEDIEK